MDIDHFDFGRILAGFFHAARPAPSSPDPGVFNMLTQISKEIRTMSDTFSAEITKLRDDVAAQTDVITSAATAFKGLADKLAAAEQAATAAGATAEQIAAVTAVRTDLEANTAALAAAIPANTPAATDTTASTPTQEPTAPASTDGATAEPAPTASAPAETAEPAAPQS